MSEKKDADDLAKAIIKIDAGPLTPFTPSAEYRFETGYSSIEEGGHVVVFSNPKNPLDTVKVVVDPMNDPIAETVSSGGTVKLKKEGDTFVVDLEGPKKSRSSSGTTTPRKEGSRTDRGGSRSGGGGSMSFSPASVSSSVVTSLAPSLKTLGENQNVILTDVRTGFSQTYENQQEIYNKLKAQEQMLAKVAAGVAGLTAVTYAIQQEINTLVVLFGAAFLVIIAALGFLIWKQMQMEKRMMYLLMRR